MQSHGASSRRADRGRRRTLVGTYHGDGVFVTVAVYELPLGRCLVVEERQRIPGVMFESEWCSEHIRPGRAFATAQGRVLANGGALGSDAESLCGSPVARPLAAGMFSEYGLARFVHVPVGRTPDA